MSDLRGMTKLERWCAEKPVDAADRIERLEAELRNAHFEGYMAGVGDSEDYDHDPIVMEKIAWKDYLEALE